MADKEDAAPHEDCLPQWCSIHLVRIMKQAMEGLKDKVPTGILLRPPKGGPGAIRYAGHSNLEGIQQSIAEVSKACDRWEQGTNQWDSQTVCSTVVDSSSDRKGASALGHEASSAEQDKLIASIRTEMSNITKEMRQAFAQGWTSRETIKTGLDEIIVLVEQGGLNMAELGLPRKVSRKHIVCQRAPGCRIAAEGNPYGAIGGDSSCVVRRALSGPDVLGIA